MSFLNDLLTIVQEQEVGRPKKQAPNQKTDAEKREFGVTKKIKDARDVVTKTDLETVQEYPDFLMKKWREIIVYAAKTKEWNWANALQLVDWTMKNTGIEPESDVYGVSPTIYPRRWDQYNTLIRAAVDALSDARGRIGDWRLSRPIQVSESKYTGKYRYFVSMPGVEEEEVEAESMDGVIEPIQNKLRLKGKKARVAHRTDSGVILKVFDTEDDTPRETIYIKQFPTTGNFKNISTI